MIKSLNLTVSQDLGRFLLRIGAPSEAYQYLWKGQNAAKRCLSCRWYVSEFTVENYEESLQKPAAIKKNFLPANFQTFFSQNQVLKFLKFLKILNF